MVEVIFILGEVVFIFLNAERTRFASAPDTERAIPFYCQVVLLTYIVNDGENHLDENIDHETTSEDDVDFGTSVSEDDPDLEDHPDEVLESQEESEE